MLELKAEKLKDISMASSSETLPRVALVLRLFTLALLAASIAVLVTDKFSLSDGTKTSFKDVVAYRFVLSTAVIGCAYTLLQIPLAIYHASTGKRLIRNNDFLLEFDFYGDKIIALLLASGVGAGFAVTFEFKKLIRDFIASLESLGVPRLEESESKIDKFLDRANIAVGLLLLASLLMAAQSIVSSLIRSAPNSGKGFFFG